MKHLKILIISIFAILFIASCSKPLNINVDGEWVINTEYQPAIAYKFYESEAIKYPTQVSFLNNSRQTLLDLIDIPTNVVIDSKNKTSVCTYENGNVYNGTVEPVVGYKNFFIIKNSLFPSGLIVNTYDYYLFLIVQTSDMMNYLQTIVNIEDWDIYLDILTSIEAELPYVRKKE